MEALLSSDICSFLFFFFFFMPSVKFFSNNSRLCTEGMHMNNDTERLKWHKVQIPVALRQ